MDTIFVNQEQKANDFVNDAGVLMKWLGVFSPLDGTLSVVVSTGDEGRAIVDGLFLVEATGPISSTKYNVASQVVSETDPLGRTTNYVYDKQGRVTQVKTPDPDGAAGPLAQPTTHYRYDAVGNVTSIVDATRTTSLWQNVENPLDVNDDGHISAIDALLVINYLNSEGGGLLPDPSPENAPAPYLDVDGNGYATAFDAHHIITVLNEPGGADGSYAIGTVFEYDNLNRVITTTEPSRNGLSELGNSPVTRFTYDDLGNQKTLTDPNGNTTTWDYDNLYRLTTETNELGHSRSFDYDNAGNLTSVVDRNGKERRFSYDRLHRQTQEYWYVGDALERTLNYNFDAVGLLTSTSDSGDNTPNYVFRYDGANRLADITTLGMGFVPTPRLEFRYDAAHNRTTLKGQIGSTGDFENTYTYDRLNRVSRIDQSEQSPQSRFAQKLAKFVYNSASQLTDIYRYNDLSETQLIAQTSYGFNDAGWKESISHTNSDGLEIAGYNWTLDIGGRLTSFNLTNPDHANESVRSFNYDGGHQLLSADRSGTTLDEQYGYDSAGNRNTDGFNPITDNRYSTIVVDGVNYKLTYDREGNLTSKQQADTNLFTDYVYDHRNRLVRVQERDGDTISNQTDYTYDIFGRRVIESADPDGGGSAVAEIKKWVYDGQNPIYEFNGNNSLTDRYFYGIGVDQILFDERLTPTDSNQLPGSVGTVYVPLTDHLNSVRDIVDTSGEVQNHIAYDTFGNITSETNPDFDFHFGYAGLERDESTGLYHSDTRYYDATMGRWINQDPIGFGGGDANLYRYVENSPAMYVDPSGLFRLFGEEWVAPWNPNAAGFWDTAKAYGRGGGRAAAGTAAGAGTGAVAGGVTGGAVGAGVGSLAGGVGAAPGAVAGATAGAVSGGTWGAFSGLFSAAFADNAKEAIIDGAKSGAVSGSLGGAVKACTTVNALNKAARAAQCAQKGIPATTSQSVSDKLSRYLLDPNHPVGGSKAKWFKEALGFTRDNLDDLARQIKFDPSKAVQTAVTEHGTKFNQVIEIIGANGRRIKVTFAWIRNKDNVVRLVTSIPTPK